jgi:hypothetical protein
MYYRRGRVTRIASTGMKQIASARFFCTAGLRYGPMKGLIVSIRDA